VSLAAITEAPALIVDRLLTPADVAQRLSMSRSFVYQEIKHSRLRAIFIGRMPRIEPAELERYIAEARRS